MYPQFPLQLEVEGFDAKIGFREITKKAKIKRGDVIIKAAPLNHPGGCTGYRLEYGDKSFLYATDTEHGDRMDVSLLKLSSRADVLVYDCHFTDEEYSGRIGIPKKRWETFHMDQRTKNCQECKSKRIYPIPP